MTPTLPHPMTEDDIVHYLANTPGFFERHADLLAAVQFTSPHSTRAVSLQERQAVMLREKIKVLEQRTADMIRHGNDNALLSDKLLQWARTLFLVRDPKLLPRHMVDEIQVRFTVPQAAIKVWGVAPAVMHEDFAQGVSENAKVLASSLMEPFCGMNTGFEAVSWLPEPLAVTSLALLPLRMGPLGSTGPAFGMMILASPDAQRFSSDIGTDLLARVAELASAALSPLR
jgi:uncharacterized protein